MKIFFPTLAAIVLGGVILFGLYRWHTHRETERIKLEKTMAELADMTHANALRVKTLEDAEKVRNEIKFHRASLRVFIKDHMISVEAFKETSRRFDEAEQLLPDRAP